MTYEELEAQDTPTLLQLLRAFTLSLPEFQEYDEGMYAVSIPRLMEMQDIIEVLYSRLVGKDAK